MIVPQPNTNRARRTALSYDSRSDRIAYGSGKLVVLRSVQDPTEAVVYSEHTKPVSAVSISPSGFYGASADPSGQVYVWSTEGDLVTKGPFGGVQSPNDIAWDFESKRVIVVGDGKERFGAAITADSGNSVGEISGHAAQINAVSIRSKRPFRAVTVDDDSKIAFFHGVPFKFQKFCSGHTNSVSDVKYHPSGDIFVTVGMDKKVVLWDGETGDFIKSIETGHTGGILAVDWIGDKIVTASTDKSVRVTSKDGEQEDIFQLDSRISNQQLGVVVAKDIIISVGLDGTLYYWKQGLKSPVKTVLGHQKSVTALAVGDHVYTGSIEGNLLKWTNGIAEFVPAHDAPVTNIIAKEHSIWSASWDKKLINIPDGKVIELASQPIHVAVNGSDFAAISENLLQYNDKTTAVPRSQAIDLYKGSMAVGSGNTVQIYNSDLQPVKKLEPLRADVSVLKFSPDGTLLAAGDNSGKILVYNVADGSVLTTRWVFHTTTVKSISWHSSGKYAATGGSDSSIYVYSVSRPARNLKFLDAHKDGVNVVDWYESGLISGGADGTIKTWETDLSRLE